eukprot:scaffold5766_cov64-Cyclotella_meneghiniana.AAC.7
MDPTLPPALPPTHNSKTIPRFVELHPANPTPRVFQNHTAAAGNHPNHTPIMSTIAPLTLFRSFLREAKKVDNYNFREYAIRRVKIGFQINRSLTGIDRDVALKEGQENLDILKRQVVLGQLYPSATSVMEAA